MEKITKVVYRVERLGLMSGSSSSNFDFVCLLQTTIFAVHAHAPSVTHMLLLYSKFPNFNTQIHKFN